MNPREHRPEFVTVRINEELQRYKEQLVHFGAKNDERMVEFCRGEISTLESNPVKFFEERLANDRRTLEFILSNNDYNEEEKKERASSFVEKIKGYEKIIEALNGNQPITSEHIVEPIITAEEESAPVEDNSPSVSNKDFLPFPPVIPASETEVEPTEPLTSVKTAGKNFETTEEQKENPESERYEKAVEFLVTLSKSEDHSNLGNLITIIEESSRSSEPYESKKKGLEREIDFDLEKGHLSKAERRELFGIFGIDEFAEYEEEFQQPGQEEEVTPQPSASPEVIPVAGPLPPEPVLSGAVENAPLVAEALSEVDMELAEARGTYASVLVEFKNKNREKKKWVYKQASDLANSVGLGETTEDIMNNRSFIHRTTRGLASKVGLEEKIDEIFHRFDKVTPQDMTEVKVRLEAAEAVYIQSKKKKMEEIFSMPGIEKEINDLGLDENLSNEEKASAIFKCRAITQAEKEWEVLQKRIAENVPPLEKGIIGKSFEKWAKLPLPARIALTTAVMTGLGMTLGTVATVGIGTTLAYRGARSLSGALAGQAAGKGVDSITKWSLERKKQKNLRRYAEGLTEDNYEIKEKELMGLKEKEENRKKRGILKKAAVMVAVGAGVNIATDLTMANQFGNVPGAVQSGQHGFFYKMFHSENTPKTGTTHAEVVTAKPAMPAETPTVAKPPVLTEAPPTVKLTMPAETPPAPKVSEVVTQPPAPKVATPPLGPKMPEATNVVEVKLSSRGFIQTFDDMKDKLKAQYPDAGKMPAGVKHFVETPSTKLAQEYGFWDAKHGTSAMGLKGEALAVDAEGHLKLEHLTAAGKPTEIIGTGEHNFESLHSDKMFAPKAPVPHEIVAPKPADVTEPQNEFLVSEPYKVSGNYKPLDFSKPVDTDLAHAPVNIHNFSHVGENLANTPKTPGAIEFDHIVKAANGAEGKFHTSVVEVAGGQKQIFVQGEAVAQSVKLPNGASGMQLLDRFQDGPKSAPIREAFVIAQDRMNIPVPKSTTNFAFENGRLSLIHGVPGHPDEIHALLNGKEIAKGLLTEKGLKLNLDPKLHHNFLMADTVYDRAFKLAKKSFKTALLMATKHN